MVRIFDAVSDFNKSFLQSGHRWHRLGWLRLCEGGNAAQWARLEDWTGTGLPFL